MQTANEERETKRRNAIQAYKDDVPKRPYCDNVLEFEGREYLIGWHTPLGPGTAHYDFYIFGETYSNGDLIPWQSQLIKNLKSSILGYMSPSTRRPVWVCTSLEDLPSGLFQALKEKMGAVH